MLKKKEVEKNAGERASEVGYRLPVVGREGNCIFFVPRLHAKKSKKALSCYRLESFFFFVYQTVQESFFFFNINPVNCWSRLIGNARSIIEL